MILASEDRVTPADLALDAYARAKEPKEVSLFSCGHFELYRSPIGPESEGSYWPGPVYQRLGYLRPNV
jgi:hypothetical protein